MLREWFRVDVPIALAAIPVAGGFLVSLWSLGPVQDLVLHLLDAEVVWKFFYILTRWGVFTSVDWQEEKIFDAYSKKAEELLPIIKDPRGVFTPEQDKAFTDAADNLIELHLRGNT